MNKKNKISISLVFILVLLYFLLKNIAFSKDVFIDAGDIGIKGAIADPVLLNDGRVFIIGGEGYHPRTFNGNPNPNLITSITSYIYDPRTKKSIHTGDMLDKVDGFTSTLLKDGRVLITGGIGLYYKDIVTNHAEIFDPSTNKFYSTGNLNFARYGHTATLLPNGKVLIIGGNNALWYKEGHKVYDEVELYDPKTGKFITIAKMKEPRTYHKAILLKNGKVLIVGGRKVNKKSTKDKLEGLVHFNTRDKGIKYRKDAPPAGLYEYDGYYYWEQILSNVEIYDPAKNEFSYAGDAPKIDYDKLFLLSDGKVLLMKNNVNITDNYDHIKLDIYDPNTNKFSEYRDFKLYNRQRISFMSTFMDGGYSSTLLPNNKLLFTGGWENYFFLNLSANFRNLNNAGIFDPNTNIYKPIHNLHQRRAGHKAVLLKNGDVVILGGSDNTNAEIFKFSKQFETSKKF